MNQPKRNLLLVDSDPIIQAMVLEELGSTFVCATASTTERAEELLNGIVFDVFFIGLSGDEGLRLIRRCHANATPVSPAIIYLTGSPSHPRLIKALEAGATLFLAKPFQCAHLAAHVEYAMSNARRAAPVADALATPR